MTAVPTLLTSDGLRLAVVSGGDDAAVLVPNGAYFAAELAAAWRRHPALVYDLRNRGASEPVADTARLERGMLNDVDDLEAVRRQAGLERIDLIAHSYVGVVAAVYAMRHPARVRRLVLLSPAPPDPAAHPAAAARRDDAAGVRQARSDAAGAAGRGRRGPVPKPCGRCCARSTSPIRPSRRRSRWGRCQLPNERAFMGYWRTHVEPSLARLSLTAAAIAARDVPGAGRARDARPQCAVRRRPSLGGRAARRAAAHGRRASDTPRGSRRPRRWSAPSSPSWTATGPPGAVRVRD